MARQGKGLNLRRYLSHAVQVSPGKVPVSNLDQGWPEGLSIALPNINKAIQPLRGRLTTAGLPIGLLRLAYRLKKVKTGRLAVLGVVLGYRRRGVAEALIQQTFQQGFGCLGYRGAELGWTLEDNVLVNRMIERVGGHRYKTYRIFQKYLYSRSGTDTTWSFRANQVTSKPDEEQAA